MVFKWTKETYNRRSVQDVEKFIGWPFLQRLLTRCSGMKRDRDRALVSALFETGGRVNEVLMLRRNMFVEKEPPYLLVEAMPVLKRYERIDSYQDDMGRTRYVTQRRKAYRTFPLNVEEPLMPSLLEYVEGREDELFRIGRKRVYQIVTGLDRRVYPHWFRAQRASQLASEYDYDLQQLLEFFNWKDLETAIRYSHMGWKKLATSMKRPQKL